MSIDSQTMRLLVAAGKNVDDLLTVAYAMESGDDARRVYHLIDRLEEAKAPPAAIGVAILALAEKINEVNSKRVRAWTKPDAYTGAKDSNRERRGMPDSQWRKLRLEIFERDGHACQYCGSGDDLTCDHVVPLIRGGGNDPDNLLTACRSCNSSKGDRLLSEWTA